jgi:hypothetical protein
MEISERPLPLFTENSNENKIEDFSFFEENSKKNPLTINDDPEFLEILREAQNLSFHDEDFQLEGKKKFFYRHKIFARKKFFQSVKKFGL